MSDQKRNKFLRGFLPWRHKKKKKEEFAIKDEREPTESFNSLFPNIKQSPKETDQSHSSKRHGMRKGDRKTLSFSKKEH